MTATVTNVMPYAYANSETIYTMERNGATYYVHKNDRGVYIAQRYTRKTGQTAQRRLPNGKLHEELQRDLDAFLLRVTKAGNAVIAKATGSA